MLKKPYMSTAYDVMKMGYISECNAVPKSKCKCCFFDTGLNNWIGLLSGEKEILQKQNTKGIDFTKVDGADALSCTRLRDSIAANVCHFCPSKPLDCTFYPFWPSNVFSEGDDYVVNMIVGFPKCPLKDQFKEVSRYFDGSISDSSGLMKHAERVALVSTWLFVNNPTHNIEFARAASGFKGYDASFTAFVSKKHFNSFFSRLEV